MLQIYVFKNGGKMTFDLQDINFYIFEQKL
jgi:hypothetical protein